MIEELDKQILNLSGPSALKERARATVKYLRDGIEDRNSRDDIARQVWWEKYQWLKGNAWWHYRMFTHWLRDYDYKESQKIYSTKGNVISTGILYLLDPPEIKHRQHRGGRGIRQDSTGYRSGGPPVENRIRERSLGGDNIPVKELQDLGKFDFGFGEFFRLSMKEGKFGEFFSLERGRTISDGNGNNATEIKSWFSIPVNDREGVPHGNLLKKMGDLFHAAQEQLAGPKVEQP